MDNEPLAGREITALGGLLTNMDHRAGWLCSALSSTKPHVAHLIGNPELHNRDRQFTNPKNNDVALLEHALKRLGFEVVIAPIAPCRDKRFSVRCSAPWSSFQLNLSTNPMTTIGF
jgi:hypothetical protein